MQQAWQNVRTVSLYLLVVYLGKMAFQCDGQSGMGFLSHLIVHFSCCDIRAEPDNLRVWIGYFYNGIGN
jgi:hypothetical protein